MSAGTAVSTRARPARGLRHAGDGLATAFGEKERDFPAGVPAAAESTGDGRIGLAHRAEFFKHLLAILAYVFVDGHFILLIR